MPRVTVEIPLVQAPQLLERIVLALGPSHAAEVAARVVLISTPRNAGAILEALDQLEQPRATYFSDADEQHEH